MPNVPPGNAVDPCSLAMGICSPPRIGTLVRRPFSCSSDVTAPCTSLVLGIVSVVNAPPAISVSRFVAAGMSFFETMTVTCAPPVSALCFTPCTYRKIENVAIVASRNATSPTIPRDLMSVLLVVSVREPDGSHAEVLAATGAGPADLRALPRRDEAHRVGVALVRAARTGRGAGGPVERDGDARL